MTKPLRGKVRPARNPIVVAMRARSQNGGAHTDRVKQARKDACRGQYQSDD